MVDQVVELIAPVGGRESEPVSCGLVEDFGEGGCGDVVASVDDDESAGGICGG